MLLIAFICILVVAIISGIVFCFFKSSHEPINLAIKVWGVLSCIILAVVCANLKSIVGAYSIFVILGLCFIMVYQMFICARPDQPTKTYFYIKGTFRGLGHFLIALAGVTLIPLTPWGLVFGVCFGLMVFFINLPFKQHYRVEIWYSTILSLCASGMIVGQGIAVFIKSSLSTAAIMLVCAGLCLLFSNFTKIYAHKNNFAKYTSRALFMIGLIIISSSIYLI